MISCVLALRADSQLYLMCSRSVGHVVRPQYQTRCSGCAFQHFDDGNRDFNRQNSNLAKTLD